MQREILKIGHPLLRKTARAVPPEDIERPLIEALIDDMIETMRSVSGAGLAAPQVGESVRICVLEVNQNERYETMPRLPLRIWINPVLEVLSPFPRISMYEGCLSVPDLRGRVERPGHVRVHFLDRNARIQNDEFRGPLASVAAHEIDHLDGVLFVDRVDSSTLCRLEEFQKYVPQHERIVVRDSSRDES